MDKPLRKRDIQGLEERITELSSQQRTAAIEIMAQISDRADNIISVVLDESKKTREQIGYQAILLKTLEDNLKSLQFDDGMGVSSKIEVSVGGELFGTGAKWVLDVDVGKANHSEILVNILEAIQLIPGIPEKVKQKAGARLTKLLDRKQ